MFKKLQNKKGSSLIGAVIVMAFLGAAVTTITTLTSTDAVSSANNANYIKARAVGNAGLQKALKTIKNGGSAITTNATYGDSEGTFDVYTDASSSRVTVVSHVNGSQATQSINTNFAGDCVELIVGGGYADDNILHNIKLKKTCNNKAIVNKMYFAWNMSDCSLDTQCDGSISEPDISSSENIPPEGMMWVCHHSDGTPESAQTITVSPFDWNVYQNYEGDFIGRCEDDESVRPPEGMMYLCHYPLGNPENYETLTVSPNAWRGHRHHPGDFIGRCEDLESSVTIETCLSTLDSENALNTCSENDGGLTLTQIDIQSATVFQAESIPNVDAHETHSGEATNIANAVLTDNGEYIIDTSFSDNLTPGTWFVIAAEFEDGSILTKEFKLGNEGGVEESTSNNNNGITEVDNGVVTIESGHEMDLEILGSAITCGVGGTAVNVRTKLCTNNNCSNLWDFEDVDGGETYSVQSDQADNDYKIIAQADLDSCANFMRTIESTDTLQVKTLRNGEQAPPLSGFGGQMSVQDFLSDYLDANGKVNILSNQVIMLFELGINLGNDPYNLNADYQDLVILMTVSETN